MNNEMPDELYVDAVLVPESIESEFFAGDATKNEPFGTKYIRADRAPAPKADEDVDIATNEEWFLERVDHDGGAIDYEIKQLKSNGTEWDYNWIKVMGVNAKGIANRIYRSLTTPTPPNAAMDDLNELVNLAYKSCSCSDDNNLVDDCETSIKQSLLGGQIICNFPQIDGLSEALITIFIAKDNGVFNDLRNRQGNQSIFEELYVVIKAANRYNELQKAALRNTETKE